MPGPENVFADMLANGEMTIDCSDVYDLLTTTKDLVSETKTLVSGSKDEVQKGNRDTMNINENTRYILRKVEQNTEAIKNLQTSISQLLEIKDMIMEGNKRVMEHGEHIKTVQRSVEQNTRSIQNFQERAYNPLENNENNSFRRQNSGRPGANLPHRVAELFLTMAKKKDIEPLIDVDNHIGSGTFGDVYVGSYKGQTVALKRINKGTNEEGRYHFMEYKLY